MGLLFPLAGFTLVLSGFAALNAIRHGRDWLWAGILCAFSFTVMLFFLMSLT